MVDYALITTDGLMDVAKESVMATLDILSDVPFEVWGFLSIVAAVGVWFSRKKRA